MSSPPPRIHLYLDWDGTITTHDTLALVARAAARAHLPSAPQLTWPQIVDAYLADHAAHTAAYQPAAADRVCVADELAWLESLVAVDRASVLRAEAAGLFRGASRDVLDAAGRAAARASRDAPAEPQGDGNERVRFRAGLAALLDAVYGGDGAAAVVSVNWSGRFIAAALGERLGADEVERLRIHANEIGEAAGGAGRMARRWVSEDRGIWTAGDKQRVLGEDLAAAGDRRVSVYVGDSNTDLACLLAADVGICVRDDPMVGEQKSLAKTIERLGISCRPIREYHWALLEERRKQKTHVLWWAETFDDITRCKIFERP